ncbi:MAG: serine/threonine-protein kinase, partial [Bacteroidota bacterium]
LDQPQGWHLGPEADRDPVVGSRIGPWAVGERIGKGGMGAVYRAERADGAYERTVALKLLRPGPDAIGLAERLRAERQILAGLEHPNIARLYDGGLTPDGLPYLALEYVDGLPLTTYATTHQLDVRARIELTLQVCDAVSHAHRHLVVHRDLKPSNVLVTPEGSARLLDFGIATLLDTDDLKTRTGVRALTPAYAAPEQVLGASVTTATDVYALGVLLYELLAGKRPYDLSEATASEVERMVCEQIPPRPSAVAAPDRARTLTGDLDTIVLKALAKEPERRYDGAAELATDLRRHLEGLPVAARPATVGYRLRSYVRRHRVGVAAASLVVLALVGGLGASLWQAQEARTERQKAERVNDFLQEMLASANPFGGRTLSMDEVMAAATRRAGDELADEPELQAAVHHTLGTTYHSLGQIPAADSLLELALSTRRTLHGDRHPETAATLHALGVLARDQTDYVRSDSLLQLALAVRRQHPGDSDLELGATLLQLGITAQRANDAEMAETYLKEAIALRGASSDTDAGEAVEALGHLYHREGRYVESDSVLGIADQQVTQHLGSLHPRRGSILVNRAWNRYYLGDLEAVRPLLDSSLAIREAALGPDHPNVATTLNDLGWLHADQGRPDLAEANYRRALAITRSAFGDEHSNVPTMINNIAVLYRDRGDYEDARALLEEALSIQTRQLGDDHPDLAYAYNNLARVAKEQGNATEAIRLFQRGLDLRRAGLPEGHVDIGTSLSSLADAYATWEQYEDALPLAREAVEIKRAALGPDHANTAVVEMVLGEVLVGAGRFEEASQVLTQAQSTYVGINGSDNAIAERIASALANAR